MIKRLLCLSLWLPLAAMEIPRFVLSGQHCQTVVAILEEEAKKSSPSQPIAAPNRGTLKISDLTWIYKYAKNYGDLHQIIDGAMKKMVKHHSNDQLTQLESDVLFHKYIIEEIEREEEENVSH